MSALWPVIAQLAVRMIAWGFEKGYLDAEQKKAFLNFVQVMSVKPNTSKQAKDVFSKLNERLKDKVQ